MKYFYKKYLILAVIGALIIGIGSYLFLNKYLDRQEILVAAKDIKKGERIEDKDIILKQYLKSSIPESFIADKKKVIGKIIQIDRKKNDPVSIEMFSDAKNVNLIDNLKKDEVLLAIDLKYFEPLIDDLKVGNSISIISTQRDKELMDAFLKGSAGSQTVKDSAQTNPGTGNNTIIAIENQEQSSSGSSATTAIESISEKNYIDSNSFQLSEKIFIVNGQIIINNLEVIDIRKIINKDSNVLINNDKSNTYIYIKCSFGEAPIISLVTKEDKFKLVVGKI
jgi:hypothetical protein